MTPSFTSFVYLNLPANKAAMNTRTSNWRSIWMAITTMGSRRMKLAPSLGAEDLATGPTFSESIVRPIPSGILRRKFVSPVTVSFASVDRRLSVSTKSVYTGSNSLNVDGIGTRSISAKMISLITAWLNNFDKHFIRKSVSTFRPMVIGKFGIAVLRNVASPNPAGNAVEAYSGIYPDPAKEINKDFGVYRKAGRIVSGHRVTPLSERWSWAQRFTPLCPSF